MTAIPTLTISGPPQPGSPDPVAEFAAKHIGDAETITIRVVYDGFEASPDELLVDRAGNVLEAHAVGPDDA